jgi:hypothetical protein
MEEFKDFIYMLKSRAKGRVRGRYTPAPALQRAFDGLELGTEVVALIRSKKSSILRRRRNVKKEKEVIGFMALVYMQMASAMDQSNKGQLLKNGTVALSRVSMREIYDNALSSDNDQEMLKKYSDKIISEFNKSLNYRSHRLSPNLEQYLAAALGDGNYKQQQLFGGMTEVNVDTEGDHGALVPVELRKLGLDLKWTDKGSQDVIKGSIYETAAELIRWTRSQR